MEFLEDNWIKQGLVILLAALTILHLDYTEACSCEFTHPQQQLCNVDFGKYEHFNLSFNMFSFILFQQNWYLCPTVSF